MRWAQTLVVATLILMPFVATRGWSQEPNDRALADNPVATPPPVDYQPAWPDPPNTGAMLARLVLGTMITLAICAGTMWFGRHWLKGAVVSSQPGGKMQVLETVSIGNRCFVHLLKAGKGQVLAGTDPTGLKALIPVPGPFEEVLAEHFDMAEAGVEETEDETIVERAESFDAVEEPLPV